MSLFNQIRWIKHPSTFRLLAESSEEAPEANTLLDALDVLGVPAVPGVGNSKDEAVYLLKVAAEVEHAFVVQYLYAMYSLGDSPTHPLDDWQRTLRTVAMEEMGHLVSVQNLLFMLGEKPYLNRWTLQAPQDLYPFELRLEPFSLASLSKYVVAESPIDAVLDPDLARLKTQPNLSVHHVGIIYAKIYWLFQSSDTPEGPWKLPDAIKSYFNPGDHLSDSDWAPPTLLAQTLADQATWRGVNAEAEGPHVLPISVPHTPSDIRTSAQVSLFNIDSQGEGTTSPLPGTEKSHFQRFYEIYKAVQAGNALPPLSIAVNPNTQSGVQSDPLLEAGRITDRNTLLWSVLFNQRYRILLTDIFHALQIPVSQQMMGTSLRRKLGHEWAIDFEMASFLSVIAQQLITLPLKEGDNTVSAGAPFEGADEPFPGTENLWQEHLRLMDASESTMSQITQDPNQLIPAIRDFDSQRRAFINQVRAS